LFNKFVGSLHTIFTTGVLASFNHESFAILPITWNGNVPYITWNLVLTFLGLGGGVGNYFANTQMFLLGVLT